MPERRSLAEIEILLAALDDAYNKPGWHGPSLRASISRVTVEDAARRPAKQSHSIAELVLHCAYWKYVGHRRLTSGKRGGFPLKGSNWFPVSSDLTETDWKSYRNLLDEMHANLCDTVASLPAKQLAQVPAGAKVSNLKLIYGLAAHDAYHTGQIRTIRNLLKQ